MWIGRRTERERERAGNRDNCPVRCIVETAAPGIRSLHLTAIEVGHRRIKFGGRELSLQVSDGAWLAIGDYSLVNSWRDRTQLTAGTLAGKIWQWSRRS